MDPSRIPDHEYQFIVNYMVAKELERVLGTRIGNRTQMIVCEDNEAVIKILAKGRTNAFRHLHRTHRIATDWIYEVLRANDCRLIAVNTKYQIADMFTKAITKSEVWEQLLDLAQIRRPTSSFPSSSSGGRPGDPHAGAPGEKKKKRSKIKSPKSSESKGSSSSSSTGKEKKPQSKKSLPIAVACLAVSQLAGCGLVLGQGHALEQSITECGYRKQEPRRICCDVDALSPSDVCMRRSLKPGFLPKCSQ